MISSTTTTTLLALLAVTVKVSGSPMPAPSMMEEPTKTAMPKMMETKMAEMAEYTSSMYAEAAYTSSSMVEAAMASSSSMMYEMSMSMSAMKSEYTQPPSYGSYNSEDSKTYSSQEYKTYSQPMYGSGSSNMGGYDSPLDQCLLKCADQFGGDGKGGNGYQATATYNPGTPTQTGSGTTHTVIVAPTKGVLRYVPFAVNASVGDMIEYVWGAGPHTVTQSNALNVCNKSLATDSFTSGQQNASFVFQVPVKSMDTVFAFCNVPTHCAKGMFGVVNPPNAIPGAQVGSGNGTAPPLKVAAVMSEWSAANPANAALVATVQSMPGMTPDIMNWGMEMDVSGMVGQVEMSSLVENVLYTQMSYALNPGMSTGSPVTPATMVIPPSFASLAVNGTGATTDPSGTSASAAAASATQTQSGAGAITVPFTAAFIAILLASFFSL